MGGFVTQKTGKFLFKKSWVTFFQSRYKRQIISTQLKNIKMKKVLFALAIVACATACNSGSSEAKTDSTATPAVDSSAAKVDSSAKKMDSTAAKMDTTAAKMDTTKKK
jgi:hypothetical protein